MSKLIYVCSPYRGDIQTNTERARNYSRSIVDEGDIPIAPHLLFPQFMDDDVPSERRRAIEMNLEIMRHCDEVRVFGGPITDGMREEIDSAISQGIPVRVGDFK